MKSEFMKRLKKVSAALLAVAMMFTSFPQAFTMLAKATDYPTATDTTVGTVVVGEWVSNARTTTWDFVTNGLATGSKSLAAGDTVNGIGVVAPSVSLKSGNAGISINGTGEITLPLDADTTSATVTFTLTSNNTQRYIVIGGTRVYHNVGNAEYTDGDLVIDTTKTGTVEVSGDAISDGKIHITVGSEASASSQENKIGKIVLTESREEAPKPEVVGNGKADVWDFGAEALDTAKYNNILTVANMNANIYPDTVTAGTSGNANGDFTIDLDADGVINNNDIAFTGGGKVNHRLRTSNTELTRYDTKTLKDVNGTVYNGYVYSNSGNNTAVSIQVYLYAGDKLDVVLSSNGGNNLYNLVSPNGDIQEFQYVAGQKGTEDVEGEGGVITPTEFTANADTAHFYAAEEGVYTLCSTNEKLAVARLTRTHTTPVTVTGSVTAPATIPAGYSVVFTNNQSGVETTAKVKANGSYKVYLYDGYTYNMKLADANGYIISNGDTLEVATGAADMTYAITVKALDLITVTGTITGLDATALAALKLKYVPSEEKIYDPEYTIAPEGTYSVKVEAGVAYTVTVDGVNDYSINSESVALTATEDKTQDIAFTKKPVYPVTVKFEGVTAAQAEAAVVTFKNIEDNYTYTFNPGEAMNLRDGQYSVTAAGLGKAQALKVACFDAIVNGEATEAKLVYSPIADWDFAKVFGAGATVDTYTLPDGVTTESYVAGLKVKNAANNKNLYLLVNADGFIEVPVKAGDKVTVNYCYTAAFTVGEVTVVEKSGSTSKIDSKTFEATEDGVMTINTISGTVPADAAANPGAAVSQTYITGIEVAATADPYKATLTVGADKDFQTVGEAVKAAESMTRTDDQRVTIVIDPGNYEEMFVINGKNITLKNASATPSTDLKDSGVNIDANAVRITSYYGHGYAYYSMGTDCKYNDVILAANQHNGYLSFENPGTGTTSGSYWNSTVVVYADGFEAKDIIFENSFNQYVSDKEAADTLVALSGAKGDRTTLEAGSTAVQNKTFVERAAALSIANDVQKAAFYGCRIIGRQDTLYGGTGVTAAFDRCQIMGACDFIFGGMTAVFNKCDLVMNTSEVNTDVAYITAPQQGADTRGYLMYECTIKSTTPGVDTASAKPSKPGFFGRPWAAGTAEVVYYNTKIETTTNTTGDTPVSLIDPAGWNNTLSGTSPFMYEYGTVEKSGVDNSANRAEWANVLTEAKLPDDTAIEITSFLDSTWVAELTENGYFKVDSVEAFVQRLYTTILGREAEAAGLTAWVDGLNNAQVTPAEAINYFVNGAEYLAMNKTSEEFVTDMYNAIMGRTPDGDGLAVWKDLVDGGVSYTFVAAQFATSTEFDEICEGYGIAETGTIAVTENRDQNVKVTKFMQTIYSQIFGRKGDVEGLNTWTGALNASQVTPQDAIKLFLTSDEAVAAGWTDADYIKVLYRVFMGREVEDQATLDGWVGYVGSHSRDAAFDMFKDSAEFTAVIADLFK